MFWIVAALLTAVACMAILLPFSRRVTAPDNAAAHDEEVYRDQLKELERDEARGLIAGAEAEQARAEIGRRLLKAAEEARQSDGGRQEARSARIAAFGAILAVPLVSWAGYGILGSPDLPAEPLAARQTADPARAGIDELIARAEAHLSANPDDGRGWQVLAPIYLRLGRASEATTAYRNAIRLNGANAGLESGLGEAIAAEAGGLVSAEAVAAFRRALELDPAEPRALFFMASAAAQEGRMDEAIADWRKLAASADANSVWKQAAEQALAQASSPGTPPAAPSGNAPGPSAAEMDAAAQMPETDRTAMISDMVSGLDARLRESPRDLEGWKRLIRSYMVLGRPDDAADALKRAVGVFGPTTEAAELARFAEENGVRATE